MFRFLLNVFFVFTVAMWGGAEPVHAGSGPFKTYSVKGAFEDVKQDVSEAIVNQGLVVDFNANVGEMLQRTSKDVGAAKQVYQNAVMIMFCSAKYTREAVEANADNIMFCPYSVMVFELADTPGTVHVGYRLPRAGGSLDSRTALLAIETLLDKIAREATGH
jgi:uncharacterized protein (DUF302 family)